MNDSAHLTSQHALTGLVTWKQPVMVLLVCLMFGPIFATPLIALAWMAASALRLTPGIVRGAEIAALITAAAPTAWLARNAWRVEGRMAQGLPV